MVSADSNLSIILRSRETQAILQTWCWSRFSFNQNPLKFENVFIFTRQNFKTQFTNIIFNGVTTESMPTNDSTDNLEVKC